MDNEDFLAAYLDDIGRRRKRGLSRVRDQRLHPKSIGSARFMARPGTGDRPVVLHADQKHASLTVGQAHDCFHQVAVVQGSMQLALELDVVLFTSRRPAGNLSG
jgi:hypothetical protein